MEKITLSQVRLAMEFFDIHGKPIPFSIGFDTCNRAKGTGGDYLEFEYCIKHVNLNAKRQAGAVPNFAQADTPKSAKNPNHWKNQTTNIAIMAKNELTDELVFTGHIHKIHYRLITKLNGKEIIWD